ncbi:MAG: T9SS type A sorting domain-containing protein [Ignavibacteriaceae bacterium]|nr:T9SS type A sorting domain-containing protein [Ignavibacteriaceae bacterium]
MKSLLIILFIIQTRLFAQEFLFSDLYSPNLTTNQHTSEVYLNYFLGYNDYYVANLRTMQVVTSPYKCLPIFSYKTNKMIYRDSTYLHLIDYDRGTNNTLKLSDTLNYDENGDPFSPNGELVLLNNFIYSFKDNSLQSISIDIPYFRAKWSSDSTIIVLLNDSFLGRQSLIEHSINSSIRDTIVQLNTSVELRFNWDYDIIRRKLYYSTLEQNDTVGYIAKLRVIDRYKKTDSTIYEYPKDVESNCNRLTAQITEIRWSGNYERMSFLLTFALDVLATNIYTYIPDSNKIIKVTNDCEHYGIKNHVYWANDDTLVYNDVSRSELFGIRIPEITGIVKGNAPVLPNGYSLTNYPNPFNGNTVIEYKIPPHETGELQIFNILGKKIISFNCDINNSSKNKIFWNGKNSYGNPVGSGIYIAVFHLNNSQIQIRPLKLVYLK